MAQKRCPRAFLAAEAIGSRQQAVYEPLEADWDFGQQTAKRRGDPVNHGAGHQCFADSGAGVPAGPVLKQVAERDVVAVFQPDQ